MSINPTLMSNPLASAENPPAPAENPPVSTAILPASAANSPASTEIPVTRAPMTYMSVGERAPQLEPSRAQAQKVTAVLLSVGSPFKPIDVVKVENRNESTYFLQRKFYTDPERREQCTWHNWPTRRFCTELLQAIPEISTTSPCARGFLETMHQVKVGFDIEFKNVEFATDENIAAILDVVLVAETCMR
jgi:hypothetical protein